MAGIAILIVTYNDQDRVCALIRRAAQLSDEIIIVDNGSIDQTIEIADRAPVPGRVELRLYARESGAGEQSPCGAGGSPRNTRNFGLSQVTKDWVLVLDNDEYISKRDFAHLEHIKNDSPHVGFFLPWNTYDEDRNLVVSDYKLSLIRAHSGVQYEGLFHENPTASVRRLEGSCGMASVELAHIPLGKLKTWKKNNYIKRAEDAVRQDPLCARSRWFLGLTHYKLGAMDAARQQLIIAGEMGEDTYHPVERINAYFLLGCYHLSLGESSQGMQWLERGLTLYEANKRDVEMVAYERIISHIRAIYHSGGHVDVSELARVGGFFYCF